MEDLVGNRVGHLDKIQNQIELNQTDEIKKKMNGKRNADRPFGQAVLITGANRGIGLELCRQLASDPQGPDLIFAAYKNNARISAIKELQELSEKCVKKIHMIPLDVTNPASIENSVKLVEEFLPERNGLNLLINNAGMHLEKVATFPTCTQEGLLEHFKVNTVGPILVTQAFFPLLEKAGTFSKAAVIQISSNLGSIQANPFGALVRGLGYSCSKAALNIFTKSMSIDFKHSGIIFISIHPGWLSSRNYRIGIWQISSIYSKTEMGGAEAPTPLDEGVKCLVEIMRNLQPKHNGEFLNWDGTLHPW